MAASTVLWNDNSGGADLHDYGFGL